MAGKMTDGTANNWDMKQISAYAEGAAPGSATNPHAAVTNEAVAWDLGRADRTGGTIDACVAGGTVQSGS